MDKNELHAHKSQYTAHSATVIFHLHHSNDINFSLCPFYAFTLHRYIFPTTFPPNPHEQPHHVPPYISLTRPDKNEIQRTAMMYVGVVMIFLS